MQPCPALGGDADLRKQLPYAAFCAMTHLGHLDAATGPIVLIRRPVLKC